MTTTIKRFNEFLMEMPLLSTNINKKTPKELPFGNGEKMGDFNNEYEVHHKQIRGSHYLSLHHKSTGENHMYVGGIFLPQEKGEDEYRIPLDSIKHKQFQVHDLKGSPKSTVRAHQFYNHLITHHGLNIQSGTVQSPGGAHTWERLAKDYPDVKVTHHNPGGETTMHSNWDNNYAKSVVGHDPHNYSFFRGTKK